MRKTRLVILPGVRSITQIGCLLLFLACPTIAFKGQEKRDVEPICKFHELKYWWLPFDTGEAENLTISTKRTGYQCQRDDMGIMKGKDNEIVFIQHSCDESILSHKHVVVDGQDANFMLKNNFGRNGSWVIHSLPGSANIDESPKIINFSERRTAGIRKIPQTVYKTVSEQRGIGSGTRIMIQIRLQRNSREGSETIRINERRHSIPISERRYTQKQTRLPFKVNTELINIYQISETLTRRNDRSRRGALELNLRQNIRIHEKDGLHKSEILKRTRNEVRENIPFVQKSARSHSSLTRLEQKHLTQATAFPTGKHNEIERQLSQRRANSEERETSQRSSIAEQPRTERRFERAASMDIDQRQSDRRSERSIESRLLSVNRRTAERNLRRDPTKHEMDITRRTTSETLRESRNKIRKDIPIFQNTLRRHISPSHLEGRKITHRSSEDRENTQRSLVAERSRKERWYERAASMDNDHRRSEKRSERSLRAVSMDIDHRRSERRLESSERAASMDKDQRQSERRSERSVESRLLSANRRTAERNLRRDTTKHEIDSTRRTTSETLRESRNMIRKDIPIFQNTLRRHSSPSHLESREITHRSSEDRENTQRSLVAERSRHERRFERAASMDNDHRRSEKRSERSLRAVSMEIDHRRSERRSESSERAASMDKDQRQSERWSERSVESRRLSANRRMAERNVRRDTTKHEMDSIPRITSETSRERRNKIREDIPKFQNTLRRRSSPSRKESREITHRQPKDFEEYSRMDRRLTQAGSNANERLSSDRRLVRSAETRVFTSDKRMVESNQRRDVRLHEYERSDENISPQKYTSRRRTSLEDRENTHPSLSAERSISGRRFERDTSMDKDQRLSDKSVRSIEARLLAVNRRMPTSNLRRDNRKHEMDNTRRITSGTVRETRNSIREDISLSQNTIRRQSSPSRLESREVTDHPSEDREDAQKSLVASRSSMERRHKRAAFMIIDHHRSERRSERSASMDNAQRLSDRSVRSIGSRILSVNRIMAESNLRRDIRKDEMDKIRRITPEIFRETRNTIREDIPLTQNTIRRTISPASLDIDHRRSDRRSESSVRAASMETNQRLPDRSLRSIESQLLSIDRRMAASNLRPDIRKHEMDNTRRFTSETLRETRNTIREDILLSQNSIRRHSSPSRLDGREMIHRSPEYRENTQRSLVVERFRIERRYEHVPSMDIDHRRSERRSDRSVPAASMDIDQRLSDRSVRSIGPRILSVNRRMLESTLRRDIRKHEMDNIRRFTPRTISETRNTIREDIPLIQNTMKRHSSPSRQAITHRSSEDRENTQRSLVTERSRLERWNERVVSIDNDHHWYERRSESPIRDASMDSDHRRSDRRSERSERTTSMNIDQRRSDRRSKRSVSAASIDKEHSLSVISVLSIESANKMQMQRKMAAANHRRDIRKHEMDNTRRITLETLRKTRNTLREDIDQHLSDRPARSIESRLISNIRRIAASTLRRDIRKHEMDNTRRFTPRTLSETRNTIREDIPLSQITIRHSSPSHLEGREITYRSSQDRENTKRSLVAERSRMDKKYERAVSMDNDHRRSDRRSESSVRAVTLEKDQHLSDRSVRSVESQLLSVDRRMAATNLRRDIAKHQRGNTRRITSETLRETRNTIRKDILLSQNTIRRYSSPLRLEGRERIHHSPEDRENNQRSLVPERSRIEWRYERAPSMDIDHRRSDRRSESSIRAATPEKDQRLSDRLVRSIESQLLSVDRRMAASNLRRDNRKHEMDYTRRITSETVRETKNTIRENIPLSKNTIQRHTSKSRLERREITQRLVVTIIQPKNFEEDSRMERLTRAVSKDGEQRLSNNRRSVRYTETRVFTSDKRTVESNQRRDTRLHEYDRSDENIFPLKYTPRRRASSEDRENTQRSVVADRSRIEKRFKRDVSMHKDQPLSDRSERSVQPSLSIRQSVQRSVLTITQPEHEDQFRMERRLERVESTEMKQRLSDIRRSAPAFKSRVLNFHRRMSDSNLRRNIRSFETDIPREELFPRRLRAEVSPASIGREPKGFTDRVKISFDRKFEVSIIRDKPYNVMRREDVSRFNHGYTQERRTVINERVIKTNIKSRREINYNKESTRRHAASPVSYTRTSYPELTTSGSQQIPLSQKPSKFVASLNRVSKSELNYGSEFDGSRNYQELQILKAQKNSLVFPSWISKITFAIKKAVTVFNGEENILKYPKDLGLDGMNMNLPGFTSERQITELRLNRQATSNDKGHILQDFVLGLVVAGYFISSIHHKIRDYRNFICIF